MTLDSRWSTSSSIVMFASVVIGSTVIHRGQTFLPLITLTNASTPTTFRCTRFEPCTLIQMPSPVSRPLHNTGRYSDRTRAYVVRMCLCCTRNTGTSVACACVACFIRIRVAHGLHCHVSLGNETGYDKYTRHTCAPITLSPVIFFLPLLINTIDYVVKSNQDNQKLTM